MNETLLTLHNTVWPLVHKEQWKEAAQAVNEACELGLKIETDNPATTLPVLQHWLHFLLDEPGGIPLAAQLLWSPNKFTFEPKCVRAVWDLYADATFGLIMGGASLGKSYSMGARMFLEWIRDPQFTTVNLIGPSEDHLQKNLFSHLVDLHASAKLPMPGSVQELWIGMDKKNQLGAIHGVVIPQGKVRKAGRLQGGKRKPREQVHPIFGALSRMMVFIDEIENVPGGLWHDIDNIASLVDEDGGDGASAGFKVFGAYNPTNRGDEVAKRAEPEKGWDAFDIESDYRWTSKRGWEVLRLDGEQSENVLAEKTIYPGIQTKAGLARIAKNAGGREAAGYYTMGRGAYPPQGLALSVIPPGMVSKMRGTFIWYDTPQPIAGADLALEGGAGCIVTLGLVGKATGVKLPPSVEFPTGRSIMFKDERGSVVPRPALQVTSQLRVEKGDTVQTANRIVDVLKKAGVRPHLFCCDSTGHGRGVADLIKNNWSSQIIALNYSESASDLKIMQEDTQTCHDTCHLAFSELWMALRGWAEFGYVMISPEVDMGQLTQQFTQRLMRTASQKSRVESKKDYIDRGHPSPDEADSITLIVHAARVGAGITPSMQGNDDPDSGGSEDSGDWNSGIIIDSTNRQDTLEDAV